MPRAAPSRRHRQLPRSASLARTSCSGQHPASIRSASGDRRDRATAPSSPACSACQHWQLACTGCTGWGGGGKGQIARRAIVGGARPGAGMSRLFHATVSVSCHVRVLIRCMMHVTSTEPAELVWSWRVPLPRFLSRVVDKRRSRYPIPVKCPHFQSFQLSHLHRSADTLSTLTHRRRQRWLANQPAMRLSRAGLRWAPALALTLLIVPGVGGLRVRQLGKSCRALPGLPTRPQLRPAPKQLRDWPPMPMQWNGVSALMRAHPAAMRPRPRGHTRRRLTPPARRPRLAARRNWRLWHW